MKASELIKELQKEIDTHGDMDVVCVCELRPWSDIDAVFVPQLHEDNDWDRDIIELIG